MSSNSKAIKAVMRELMHLNGNPPAEGVKLIDTSDTDLLDIQAWIVGPEGTPYHGGCFKVRLVPGPDFPESPPKGYFETKIFHPNVSKSGEICVNTLKKDWKPDLGIAHVLLTIRCLLIAPNAESALNDDAGKLLLEEYDAFAKHARLFTAMHAKPPHPSPFPDLITQAVLNALAVAVNCGSSSSSSAMAVDEEKPLIAVAAGGLVFSSSSSMGGQVYQSGSSGEESMVLSPTKKRILESGGERKAVPVFGAPAGMIGGVSSGGGASGTTKVSDKKRTLKRL
ncbi:ubiquitin-conjugating enzyme E2 S [Rhizoclosmatium sp. JEL0117]|nr:ubiquitin-conjugating enzyme E2 S [Rhizoclosmatium sp. JEL0117]